MEAMVNNYEKILDRLGSVGVVITNLEKTYRIGFPEGTTKEWMAPSHINRYGYNLYTLPTGHEIIAGRRMNGCMYAYWVNFASMQKERQAALVIQAIMNVDTLYKQAVAMREELDVLAMNIPLDKTGLYELARLAESRMEDAIPKIVNAKRTVEYIQETINANK